MTTKKKVVSRKKGSKSAVLTTLTTFSLKMTNQTVRILEKSGKSSQRGQKVVKTVVDYPLTTFLLDLLKTLSGSSGAAYRGFDYPYYLFFLTYS